MKKKIYLSLVAVFMASAGFSQYHIDAQRFSQNNYNGTARSISMGNSLSAVGGDLSVLALNPAGIGVFKKSQISITQSFMMASSVADFQGTNNADQRYDYAINNFGYVGAITNESGDWRNISFGISYNRLNNFTQLMTIDGKNKSGSILDFYNYNANSNVAGLPRYEDGYGDRWSDYRDGLAHADSLILIDGNTGEYFSPVTDKKLYGERQRKVVTKRGGAGEWDFTFGASYKDIIYFGGTFGLTSLRYISDTYYKESEFTPVKPNGVEVQPDYLEYNESLSTKGTGMNFKFGVLAQPVKFIRLGGAIHSSTFYTLNEEFQTTMNSRFFTGDSNGNLSYSAPLDGANTSTFAYSLRTPFRANAGIAFVLDSYEAISGYYTMPMIFSFGYEYLDYSRAKLTGDGDAFLNDNAAIASMYQATHNLNAGYEMNFGLISGRFGYSLHNSAAIDDSFFENARSEYSAGFGFKGKNAYIDFAYTLVQSNENNYMYGATDYFPNNPIGDIPEPMANITNTNHFLNITTGLKF